MAVFGLIGWMILAVLFGFFMGMIVVYGHIRNRLNEKFHKDVAKRIWDAI